MRKRRWLALICLIAFLLAGVSGTVQLAEAQQAEAPKSVSDSVRIAALEEKLRVMEERLEQLESKLAEKDAALVASNGAIPAAALSTKPAPSFAGLTLPPPAVQAAAQTSGTPTVGAGAEGFSIQSAAGDFRLNIRYQMNVDGRFAADPHGEPNTFYLRRAQPILDGTLYKRFSFRVLTDFGQGKQRVLDAYIDTTFAPWLKLRVGKFKGPVGLERLMSGQVLPLMERAFPSQLTPNRDLGVQLFGDPLGGRLSYAVGVFNGVSDNASADLDTDDQKEFEGRIFALPFRQAGMKELGGLGLGIGVSYGRVEGSDQKNYITSGQRPVFQATLPANGVRRRLAPQAYYYYGPVGVLGEYVLSAQNTEAKLTAKETLAAMLKNFAWQAQTSVVLSGENASYNGVIPAHVFDPSKGTYGAFELTARFSKLHVDRRVLLFVPVIGSNSLGAEAWALGLNWYMNRNVRWMFDYEQTGFKAAARSVSMDSEKVFLQRFQLRF